MPTPHLVYTHTPTRELNCEFDTQEIYDGRIVYYRNGEEWVKDINSLTGVNEITARYLSNGGNVLHSEMSNMVSVITTDVKMTISNSGNNQIAAVLSGGREGLFYKFEITWYDGEVSLGTGLYDMTAFSSATAIKTIPTYKAGKAANRIEVIVKIYGADGNMADSISAIWSK